MSGALYLSVTGSDLYAVEIGKRDELAEERGAHAPSRAVSGALAGHPAAGGALAPMRAAHRDGIGEGADSGTRGRVRSPDSAAPVPSKVIFP